MKIRTTILLAASISTLSACGDPTDRPEDCTTNQYFDESRKLCVTCAAIRQPVCDQGCAFEITLDRNDCPVANCLVGDACNTCDPGEYFDSETLACQTCDGPTECDGDEPQTRYVDGRCLLTCP